MRRTRESRLEGEQLAKSTGQEYIVMWPLPQSGKNTWLLHKEEDLEQNWKLRKMCRNEITNT